MGNKDWTKYFLDKFTFSNAHQVSVSGKTTKTNFYMSAGVENNNGILANIVDVDNYKRYNMRLKGSYNLTDWFTLSNNTSYISTQRIKPSAFWDSNMDMFYNLAPQDHDINPDGSWANNDAGRVLASLNDGGKDLRTYDRFQSIFGGELRFFKDKLKLNANYSYLKGAEDYNWYETKYNIGYGPDDIRAEGNSRAYRTYAKDLSQILDIFATLNISKGNTADQAR